MLVKDQLHTNFEFLKTPKRIVSLVPSQTELLIDLGLKDKVVGITKFCVHPIGIKEEIAVVGGTKAIHLDKIRALRPDIIICNKEENTKEIVSSCSTIAPVWVSDIYTISDCLEMISMLGTLFKKENKATEIIDSIKVNYSSFLDFVKDKPLKKVAYLIWKDPYMLAGKQTFINSLLRLNKFKNIIEDPYSRYPEIRLEKLEAADLVLLSSEPFPFKPKHVLALQQELDVEVKLVDGAFFSWYGSRLEHAFTYFKSLH